MRLLYLIPLAALVFGVYSIPIAELRGASSLSTMASSHSKSRDSSSPSLAACTTEATDTTSQEEEERSLPEILFKCLGTLFVCTWSAIHPDLPKTKNRLHIIMKRLSLMWAMVLSPEVVINWAMCQRRDAERVAQETKRSMMYSYFLVMGGFSLQDETHTIRFLETGTESLSCIAINDTPMAKTDVLKVNWSKISEERINDHSKSDALNKALLGAQTGWFTINCISRWSNSLSVTDLEIATLAYAALNIITLVLWTHKPIGADIGELVEFESIDESVERYLTSNSVVDLQAEASQVIPSVMDKIRAWWPSLQWPSLRWSSPLTFTKLILHKIFLAPITPLMDTELFFEDSTKPGLIRRRVLLALFSLIFGGLHFIRIFFVADSPIPTWLWAGCAITIAVMPIALYTCFLLDRCLWSCVSTSKRWGGFWSLGFSVTRWLKYACIGVYVFARLALLVMPFFQFATLRILPEGKLGWYAWLPFS